MPAPVIKLFLWRIAAELLLSQLVACLKGDPYGRDSISGLARRVRIMQQQAISKGVTDDWQTNAVLDIEVMFADNPRVYKENIYYQGVAIGQIIGQTAGHGSVYKVTVRLVPEYRKEAGRHWVFYADNGALNASKISPAGQPLGAGDKVCGFDSKAALNWFKLKTLLSDRVYKANRMANELSRRFG